MLNPNNAPRCYTRKEINPYHDKLKQFENFVFLDHQAEEFKGQWNQHIFKNANPLIVEIGVGYGDFMTHYCSQFPQHNFVGMDIRFKRSFSVAKKLEESELSNIRFLRAQGQRLPWLFAHKEIDQIFCFFPDPWPRKKQHKRRLFQKELLQSLGSTLKENGNLLFKTDHQEMFEWVLNEVSQCSNLKILWKSFDLYQDYNHISDEKIKELLSTMVTFQTKFEKIFLQQSTTIKALILCPQPQ
jgi:tRNA (guanine-N7-)-methyltransferase